MANKERYSYYKNTETGDMYKIDNYRDDSISMMLNMAYEPLIRATSDEYAEYCRIERQKSTKQK